MILSHWGTNSLLDFAPLRGIAVICAFCLSSATVHSQSYPVKPVTVLVPAAPGGIADLALRRITLKAQDELGQSIIIQNRPGAGGSAAPAAVKIASPDGYTLLQGSASTHAVNKTLVADLPYDPIADFRPITLLYSISTVLAVPAKSPAKSARDLVSMAKTKSGGLFYLSPGIGSASHLAGEMLRQASGAPFTHVAHKGVPQALLDLAGERADLFFTSLIAAQPFLKDGRVRLIGITTPRRAKELPDIPTMAESGYPSVEIDFWFGLLAPAKTPDVIVRRLNDAFGKSLANVDLIQTLSNDGVNAAPSTPEQFAGVIVKDIERYGKIVKASGATSN